MRHIHLSDATIAQSDADPDPIYRPLRREAPVSYTPTLRRQQLGRALAEPRAHVVYPRRPRRPSPRCGFGPHCCAGTWMAPHQMKIALRSLLENFREVALACEFFGWEFRAPKMLFAGLAA